jgi:hypothetical protein
MNGAAPMDQSREAHLAARPLHSPNGGHTAPYAPNPRRPSMKRPGEPLSRPIPPSGPPEATPGRHDPLLAASAGTTLRDQGISNVLSCRYATSPIRAIPDTPRPKLLLSRAMSALTAR